jgi:hypothetical protein
MAAVLIGPATKTTGKLTHIGYFEQTLELQACNNYVLKAVS